MKKSKECDEDLAADITARSEILVDTSFDWTMCSNEKLSSASDAGPFPHKLPSLLESLQSFELRELRGACMLPPLNILD